MNNLSTLEDETAVDEVIKSYQKKGEVKVG
jgi:hypothetical protein